MSDLVNYNRHALASALRRLSQEALEAAAVCIDLDCQPDDESQALTRVLGRVESVKHARVLLNATRHGAARAPERRKTA